MSLNRETNGDGDEFVEDGDEFIGYGVARYWGLHKCSLRLGEGGWYNLIKVGVERVALV